MSKALILIVVIVGPLVFAQHAQAKEVEEVVACGSSACRT
jgi:hypothetical protein